MGRNQAILMSFLFGVSVFAASCAKDPVGREEVSPEDFAREMGLPLDSDSRKVPVADFPKYDLVVDVFRMSAKLPVLGAFKPEYVDDLVPDRSLPDAQRLATAQKKFADLAGREIAIMTISGRPYRAQIVSGAIEAVYQGGYKTTPPGNYKLTPIAYLKNVSQPDGTTKKQNVLYPWLRSETYDNSQMFWGLWIFGGYFFHSTPHYGELGKPASMGCVRQSFPDAMEAFQLAQTHTSMIRIHAIGSQEAYDRFREVADMDWALPRLDANLRQIRDYMTYARSSELNILGHAWVDPSTGKPSNPAWPTCGPVDCFKIWGVKQPANPVSLMADE